MTINKFLFVLIVALPLAASTIPYSPAAENLLPLPGQLVPTSPFTQPLDAYLDGVNQYAFNSGSTLLCYFRPPPYQFQEVCQSQTSPFLPLSTGLPPLEPPPPLLPPPPPPPPPHHHRYPSPVPEPRWGVAVLMAIVGAAWVGWKLRAGT